MVRVFRMQRRGGFLLPSGSGHNFEGVAGIHNPSGGGFNDFQLFDAGSADRGERRLNGAF